jgi:DNA modification methylase
MTIEWVEMEMSIGSLKDYERNPRRINKDQFNNLVKSLKEDGYHQRLLVDRDGTIIGGHQRKKALLAAGFLAKDKIPVLLSDRPLTEEEFKRLNIRDNLPYGEFDFDILGADFDVSQLVEWGMPEEWLPIVEEVSGGGLTDEDSCPDISKDATTKLGDTYVLGNHKLMCADATSINSVDKLMDGMKADMVFTDPPYGVSYSDKNKSLNKIKKGNRIQNQILNDHMSVDETGHLWFQSFSNMHMSTTDKATYYICSPQGGELMMMMMMIQKAGWQLKHSIIWAKNNFVLGHMDYHYKHEPIMYGWKDKESHNWYGDHSQTSLWEINRPQKSELHPTMKPIELVEKALLNSSKKSDVVLDLFGGSGSTLIACEKTNRSCYMMELSPNYCDVIIKRWEDFTGKKAELIKTDIEGDED